MTYMYLVVKHTNDEAIFFMSHIPTVDDYFGQDIAYFHLESLSLG